jgi:hypothetical protein
VIGGSIDYSLVVKDLFGVFWVVGGWKASGFLAVIWGKVISL